VIKNKHGCSLSGGLYLHGFNYSLFQMKIMPTLYMTVGDQ